MDASYATPLSFTRFDHARPLSLRVWLFDSEEMVSRIRHDGSFTQVKAVQEEAGQQGNGRGRWIGIVGADMGRGQEQRSQPCND